MCEKLIEIDGSIGFSDRDIYESVSKHRKKDVCTHFYVNCYSRVKVNLNKVSFTFSFVPYVNGLTKINELIKIKNAYQRVKKHIISRPQLQTDFRYKAGHSQTEIT